MNLKSLLNIPRYKYYRLMYKLKYGIPFFDQAIDSNKVVNFLDYTEGLKSAAVIGKGASIYKSSPKEMIEKCAFKCILNSVDVEHLEQYIGSQIDAQITMHVSAVNTLMPVLPKETFKKKNIKLLIGNIHLWQDNGNRFKRYYSFFHDRVNHISHIIPDENCKYDYTKQLYGGESLSTGAALVKMLLNVDTLEKIVFAGVDAYHFGYAQSKDADSNIFYSLDVGHDNVKEKVGRPFLNFLFEAVIKRNDVYPLEVYFPKVLKQYIDFPNHTSFKFYD